MKKRHPADLAAEEQMIAAIRTAEHFLASLFMGVGVYDKTEAPTVLAALEAARQMEAAAPGTRRSMIYAVGQDGRATLLTNDLITRLIANQEKAMNPAKTTAPKATAKAAPSARKKQTKSAAGRARYDWTGAEEKAVVGKIPPKPDFSAPTHKPWLGIFEEIIEACAAPSKEERVKALKSIKIKPTSSTPKAMDRYRNLCIKALHAA